MERWADTQSTRDQYKEITATYGSLLARDPSLSRERGPIAYQPDGMGALLHLPGLDIVDGAKEFGHGVQLFGEGLVAGAESAINGATQFINHATDAINNATGTEIGKIGHLEVLSNRSEVDNSWQGSLGEFAGKVGVFAGVATAAGALGLVEAGGLGAGLIAGGITNGVLTESNETGDGAFFFDRAEKAAVGVLGSALGAAAGELVAGNVVTAEDGAFAQIANHGLEKVADHGTGAVVETVAETGEHTAQGTAEDMVEDGSRKLLLG